MCQALLGSEYIMVSSSLKGKFAILSNTTPGTFNVERAERQKQMS